MLVILVGNHGPDAVSPEPVVHTVATVALVTGQQLRTLARTTQALRDGNLVHHRLDAHRIMHLTGSDFDSQGYASAVSNQVELAAESASRAAQSVIFRLVRVSAAAFLEAPAAARVARTDEPSIHQRSQSISPSASSRMCRASRMRSYTPSLRHLAKWSYMVCQGPNRSGRSRHGARCIIGRTGTGMELPSLNVTNVTLTFRSWSLVIKDQIGDTPVLCFAYKLDIA